MLSILALIVLTLLLLIFQFLGPILRTFGTLFKLWNHTAIRRTKLLSRLRTEPNGTSIDPSSRRIIAGFFHPYCNAGGGGERVLWVAIRATQRALPNVTAMVYTGDNVPKSEILHNVKTRFDIELDPSRLEFIYLQRRKWVDSETWPRFTLAGQSLGSIWLALEAFSMLVPDIYIDTMGYAFTVSLAKALFGIPTAAYVHYPTISTDMLGSLSLEQGLKKMYWQAFAAAYRFAGKGIDVVTTNSTWTAEHITSLWHSTTPVEIIFPPCAVRQMVDAIPIDGKREKLVISIAQFRPEKNHELIIRSFAAFLEKAPAELRQTRLILVGSVRHDVDEKKVYELRLLAKELKIEKSVEFVINAPWPDVMGWLARCSVGINAMWNEHFGIGVVEYQAAGLISVVHNSGGPKKDIVVNHTGYHATDIATFADGLSQALTMNAGETKAMRMRARESSKRFSEEVFDAKWDAVMDRLVDLEKLSGGGWKAEAQAKKIA